MAVQSSVLTGPFAGKAGMRAATLADDAVATLKGSGAIAFGLAVAVKTFPTAGGKNEIGQVVAAATDVTGTAFRGFAMYVPSKGSLPSSPTGYADLEEVSYVKRGRIFAQYDSGGTAPGKDTGVYVRYAAGSDGTVVGAVSGTSSGSETALLPRARFVGPVLTDSDATKIIEIELL